MEVILSSTFFGPVQWYQKLYRADHCVIEHCDSYQKQTYRNRCLIAAPNGLQPLTVPVGHNDNATVDTLQPTAHCHSTQQTFIPISEHGDWRHRHWQAIVTAYSDSPFFIYYAPYIKPFFTDHFPSLYHYNEAIRQTVCQLLDIHPRVSFSTEYVTSPHPSILDLRDAIRPKHPMPDPQFHPKPYYQVFASRHGFLPNLSILDLLMNMGPESIYYL